MDWYHQPVPRDGTETRTRILDAAERLTLDRGFAGASVDAVLDQAGVSKGAFFHHFPAKTDLAGALIDRWNALDETLMRDIMSRAERLSDDPLQQLLLLVGLIAEAEDGLATAPACLFAAFSYQQGVVNSQSREVIANGMLRWRRAIAAKLAEAVALHPPRVAIDADILADQFLAVLEGAFVLSRAHADPGIVSRQLRQYRSHLQLLFDA